MNSVLGEYRRRKEAIWRPVFPFLSSDTESFLPILKLTSIESVMPSNHLILCPALPFPFSLNFSSTSGSLPVSQPLDQVAKVLELQLQHQSFQ